MVVAAEPVVNVYREASFQSEVTSQVLYGWPVEQLERDGEWALIQTHDGYTGWVQIGSFRPGETGSLRVQGTSANLYAEPDVKSHAAILQLPWESRLCGLAETDGWWKLRLPDGREAFVQSGDVTSASPNLTIGQMLELAHRFLRVTYTWGGVSSFGFDCSGFVQMLFRQRGITIPRDAQAQAEWDGFREIPIHEAQAGDLLFFGASPHEITHVGMSLGAGAFIHDTTEAHPGVQVSHLADQPWATRVCAARRLRHG